MRIASNRGGWNTNEQLSALQQMKSMSEEEGKVESLVNTTAPLSTVGVLVQLLKDQSLNIPARKTAITILRKILSSESLQFREAYIIAFSEDVLRSTEAVIRSDPDIAMRASAAMIMVSLLLACEEHEDDEDETDSNDPEHPAPPSAQAQLVSERTKALSLTGPDLASQCAQVLMDELATILKNPDAPRQEPSVKDVVRAIDELASSSRYAIKLIAMEALPRLVETVERLGERDEVYTPAIEALYNLLAEDDDERVEAFLANEAIVGRLRARIAALLDAYEKEKIALSWEARAFSKYVTQQLNDALPEPPGSDGTPEHERRPAADARAAERKHIMLSYAHAQKERVIEVAAALERRGLLVWRDEVGTEWCQKMSGDTDSKMAEAVDKSYCVVCFLSREYCASDNCKKEVRSLCPLYAVRSRSEFAPRDAGIRV